jgi:hypothetical protein
MPQAGGNQWQKRKQKEKKQQKNHRTEKKPQSVRRRKSRFLEKENLLESVVPRENIACLAAKVWERVPPGLAKSR